jgi:predicted RNA-binding protein YlxR (DUF448 family)
LPARRKHVPLRTCVVCHQKRPKRDLIRVVRTPEGAVQIDPTGKMAGRGAYLCSERRCWENAALQRTMARALKSQLSAGDMAVLETFAASLPAIAE